MQSTTSTSFPFRMFFLFTHPSSAIANQESLSGIETEMRKLEGVVKEIVDELNYLKKREEKFANTNSTLLLFVLPTHAYAVPSLDEPARAKFCLVHTRLPRGSGRMADLPPARLL